MGWRPRSNWSLKDLRGFINGNEVIDLGYEGVPWTWTSTWDSGGEIKERLDRVLFSMEWFTGMQSNTPGDSCFRSLWLLTQRRKGKKEILFCQQVAIVP